MFEAVLKTDGIPAFAIKPQDLAANLKAAFPEFSSVSVNIGIPASLSVAVVERQPVLLWQQGDTTTWIDKDGYSFPSRGEAGTTLVTVKANGNPPGLTASADTNQTASGDGSNAAVPTPPTTVPVSKPFISPDLVAAILSLAPQAPNATPILYDPVHGLGWVDPNGWQVYFGTNLTDMTMKLHVYYAIVTQLTQQGIIPVMISVEFPHAPFYRMEK